MSLSTLPKFKAAVAARPAELEQARKNGRKVVGWLNYNTPEEIIHALGLIPVQLGIGGDDKLVDLGGSFISTKNCVYVRETVGLFAENKNPLVALSDIIAVDATCLQIYRVAELIEYYFKRDVVILDVPKNPTTSEGRTYFQKEVAAFARVLGEKTGTKLGTAALQKSIDLYREIRATVQEIYRYQAVATPVITWREVRDVIHARYSLDPVLYLQLVKELRDELHVLAGATPYLEDSPEVRIMISGSILPPGDNKLIQLIESNGGRIVVDDTWSGLVPFLYVDVKAPTPEAVAEAYLERVPHGALPHLDLKSDRRLKLQHELVKEYHVDGVIYHTLRYCDPYTFKANETKELLKQIKIPLLEIHTEYAGSDIEAIRTRAEAFIELLRNRRKKFGQQKPKAAAVA